MTQKIRRMIEGECVSFKQVSKMRNLLATTAIAVVALSGAASAQSVLERVLTKIDNSTNLASVNGTFANIAENIGGTTTVYYDAATNTTLTQAERDALAASLVNEDFTAVAAGAAVNNTTGEVISAAAYANLSAADKAGYTVAAAGDYYTGPDGLAVTSANVPEMTAADLTAALNAYEAVSVAGATGVDGSINNAIQGVTAAVAEASQKASAGSTVAYQFDLPTYDLGDLSTTALGAVNTGTITLGVNSAVDEAKTSSTQAVSSVMDQIGGSADTGAIVLNVASNMTGVNGSINNTMNDVNGALLSASTTALGAVNTGVITSGVNAAVQGIVGTSGQTNGIAP
jgi:hypothetical protein